MADPSGVDHVVDRFHDLEQTAPLAIEDDWRVLTQLVETAAAIAPGDTEARTRLVTAAYEADRSVQNVVGWVRSVCGVDLTLPGHRGLDRRRDAAPPTTTPAASGLSRDKPLRRTGVRAAHQPLCDRSVAVLRGDADAVPTLT